MEYSIILPCEFNLDEWYNIGIDFHPQWVTANHRVSKEEKVILDLKRFAIELDNRYVRDYLIIQTQPGWMEIKIKV